MASQNMSAEGTFAHTVHLVTCGQCQNDSAATTTRPSWSV